MTYPEELKQKKQDLENLLPQLIDLKQGFLPELNLKAGKITDLLLEVIQDVIDNIDIDLKKEGN